MDIELLERALLDCDNDIDTAIKRLQEATRERLGPVEESGTIVDLFVREIMGATRVDDAKARPSRLLEVLEKSISNFAAKEAAQSFHKENILLKEYIEVLIQENTILKCAMAI
ncbi:hypothetical protein CRYUN_Cryun19dG0056400 [Craigia yunnanensis]